MQRILLRMCFVFAIVASVHFPAPSQEVATPSSGDTAARKRVEVLPSPDFDVVEKAWMSLLAREIGRQALILAARDQVGVGTRDILLREGDRVTAGNEGRLFQVRVEPVLDSDLTIGLDAVHDDDRQQLAAEKTRLANRAPMSYKPVLDFALQVSESLFATQLRKAGFEGKAATSIAAGNVPAPTEQLLQRMSIPSQYAAVRRLHAQISKEGYSPQATGALIRGYANLSMFPELHWSSSHHVLKARAMLYAQRMLRTRDDAWARAHRAYAFTIAGLHAEALEDLAKSKDLLDDANRSATKPASLPDWTATLEAVCRFETSRPEFVPNDGPLRELSILLAVRNAEWTKITPMNKTSIFDSTKFDWIQKLAELAPHCSRIDEAIHITTSYDTHEAISNAARRKLAASIYPELDAVPDLPARVRELVRSQLAIDKPDEFAEYRARAQIITALYDAGAADESGDLSWSVLASLLEDVTFAWCHCQVNASESLDEDVKADLLELYEPMVRRHPFAEVLQVRGVTWTLRNESYASVLAAIDEANCVYFDDTVYGGFPNQALVRKFRDAGFRHIDDTYPGLILVTRLLDGDRRREMCNQLYTASPFSPLGVAAKIESDWKSVKQRAEEWESRYAGETPVMRAMGVAHLADGNTAAAERCLLRYGKVMNDYAAYIAISEAHRRDGNLEAAIAMWKDAIKTPMHPEAIVMGRTELCRALVDAGRYAEVLATVDPWTTPPVESLILAADSAEYLRDFPQGDARFRELADRLSDHWPSVLWYAYSIRTGHGDTQEAKKRAESFISRCQDSGNNERAHAGNDLSVAARVALLMGKREQATQLLESSLGFKFNLADAWHRILLAEEQGDDKTRDTWLARIKKDGVEAAKGAPVSMGAIKLAELLTTAHEQDGLIGQEALTEVLNKSPVDECARLSYFAGRYYEIHKQPALAEKLYRQAAAFPRNCLERGFACQRLRELGIEPNEIKVKLEIMPRSKPVTPSSPERKPTQRTRE